MEKFRWVPLKTRYDKTESVIRFGKKYGNYATVADKIWRSIKNPVLMSDFEDLAKGNNPEKNMYFYDKKIESLKKKIGHELIISAAKENAYFQIKTNLAKPMRTFHNWIKSNIIYTICNPMYQDNKQLSVLDFGCGKGQDLMKFYHSKAAFYVGIDIDKEGIISPVDGALSRYNQFKKSYPNFPKMYFLQADVSANMTIEAQRNALGVRYLDNENIFNQFFSADPKKRTLFDRINCQFTIHYMLKNQETWKNFMDNVSNYMRNDGFLMATTFDAHKVVALLGDNDKYTQEYTDENGKTKTLFEIVKKYEQPSKNTVFGTGNAIDVYLSWFSLEGRYLTEYLVDSEYIIKSLKEIGLTLIDTDSFLNQLNMHEAYITKYSKYELIPETNKFLRDVSHFYKDDSITSGCKVFNSLMRYYIFRRDTVKTHKGGNTNDNSTDYPDDLNFSDKTKFAVPDMAGYNVDYSCINSIHHIMQRHRIIPKYISPKTFAEDIGLKRCNDSNIDDLKTVAKKVVVYNTVRNEKTGKDIDELMIDGVNIFIVERDCNNDYDIDLVKKDKKSLSKEMSIILMKEGNWYVPVYYIDPVTNKRLGIFDTSHNLIKKMLNEI